MFPLCVIVVVTGVVIVVVVVTGVVLIVVIDGLRLSELVLISFVS